MSEIDVVKDQLVALNNKIGKSGNSGTTNFHLHIEYVPKSLLYDINVGKRVNPDNCIDLNTNQALTLFDGGVQKDDNAHVFIDSVYKGSMVSGVKSVLILPLTTLSPGNHNVCVYCNNSATGPLLNRCTLGFAIGESFTALGAFTPSYFSGTGGTAPSCTIVNVAAY